MGSHRASGLQSSRPIGERPARWNGLGEQQPPLTFESFMAAYWFLPASHRQRLFWALPTELQDACWEALQAQLDRIRGES